jgi:hypothetical protein
MNRLEFWLGKCIELCTVEATPEDIRAAELALNLAQRWPPQQTEIDLAQSVAK